MPSYSTLSVVKLVENIGFEPICVLLAKQVSTPSRPIPQIVVRRERLELSILSALASKTSVYTIPPPTHYTFMSTFMPRLGSTGL